VPPAVAFVGNPFTKANTKAFRSPLKRKRISTYADNILARGLA